MAGFYSSLFPSPGPVQPVAFLCSHSCDFTHLCIIRHWAESGGFLITGIHARAAAGPGLGSTDLSQNMTKSKKYLRTSPGAFGAIWCMAAAWCFLWKSCVSKNLVKYGVTLKGICWCNTHSLRLHSDPWWKSSALKLDLLYGGNVRTHLYPFLALGLGFVLWLSL